ncbi:MAG: nitrous oxide reductase accessory protein NosL [Saprospiraceae bacterium]|nr:nitrous oxide reductase accessory protein NosL [Saprospiraceae bacterium]
MNNHVNHHPGLSTSSRIILAFATGMLVAVFFLPAWRIDLYAPQYPEGLVLNIWTNRLSGDVDIINGLNHYIGMKPFSNASFPEFKFLNFVVYFFIALGLAVALTGSKRLLKLYLMLAVIGGVVAIVDFYQWGYEYGHDLDPKAAIQVPGLSYQPPVLGHKRLLNFDAYSFPDIGGWFVIVSTALFVLIFLYEWYKRRKINLSPSKTGVVVLGYLLFSLSFCTIKPEPLVAGQDACTQCKMTIIETQYGCELVTSKGKVYKFDDIACMKNFMQANPMDKMDIRFLLISNFNKKDEWLNADSAGFYSGSLVKSPMGSNAIAFANEQEARLFMGERAGSIFNWSTISQDR